MSFFPGCCPIGGEGGNVTHTIVNVGTGAQWYVAATGPDPFEFRTAVSSDGSLTITQNATEINLQVPPPTIDNVGGFAEIWISPSGPDPFKLRTLQSSDGSITITQNTEDIDFVAAAVSVPHDVFQEDSTATKSTNSATYVLVTNLPGDAKVLNGETWRIDMGIFVCHPVNVFTVNTWIQWKIETSAGVFTQFDEWQINAPILVLVGEPSMPFSINKKLVASMDAPRMQVNVRMTVLTASSTFVEMPRWGGDQIAEAP